LTFVCSAGDGRASVYGTDVYTAESGVCAAAIHAGVLPRGQAGAVTVVFGSAAESFVGSQRNGVTTLRYGRWPNTYSFARDGAPGRISWTTVWNQIPADFFDAVTLECPPGGRLGGPVWGTDTYTMGSTICVAAVHAGVITAEKGGVVSVARAPGLREYPGTARFGVTSASYGTYPDAFTVKAARGFDTLPVRTAPRPASSEPPPASSPSASGVGPRTIQVAAFTLVGANPVGAAAAAPRTVQIGGFTATGATAVNAPANVAPRTITTTGFTLVGASGSP
jgi:hypothetical protein